MNSGNPDPAAQPGLRRASPGDLEPIVALQHAAYAENRTMLGVEPLPLRADYAAILGGYEVWLAEEGATIGGVLILEPRPDDLLIWSIATHPASRQAGLGRRLLAKAEERARSCGTPILRLYTGQKLTGNIAWYSRHGFLVERTEPLSDRVIVHMVKPLDELASGRDARL